MTAIQSLIRDADIRSRPPCGGRPVAARILSTNFATSGHAPRAGGDKQPLFTDEKLQDIRSRPPCGGRLQSHRRWWRHHEHQVTPPVRGATEVRRALNPYSRTSGHAPRAGGDVSKNQLDFLLTRTSGHAPRAGGDRHYRVWRRNYADIRSRPPCGGRPGWSCTVDAEIYDIRSRPPCGGRQRPGGSSRILRNIRSRPPCGGRPVPTSAMLLLSSDIRSRPPCGGRHHSAE